MFAIIKTGGKQLKVAEKDEIFIEKIDTKNKTKIIFDQILMIDDHIGSPYLKDAKVKATVLKQGKESKVVVYKYKPKKNYHKKYGHRQPYTKVRIDEIILTPEKTTKKKTGSVKKTNNTKKTVAVRKNNTNTVKK